jgi:hypothetical protein
MLDIEIKKDRGRLVIDAAEIEIPVVTHGQHPGTLSVGRSMSPAARGVVSGTTQSRTICVVIIHRVRMHYWGTVMVRRRSAPSPSFEPDTKAQAASVAFDLPLNPI